MDKRWDAKQIMITLIMRSLLQEEYDRSNLAPTHYRHSMTLIFKIYYPVGVGLRNNPASSEVLNVRKHLNLLI